MAPDMKSKQLKLLLNDFELLSQTALTQVQIATKLLEDNSITALYEEAKENEIIMDRLEIKIREEVVFTIFQFTPKASDLRQIITYQDITTNLERVGDMLLNIIHFICDTDLNHANFSETKKLVTKMLKEVSSMLRSAIFSFSAEDSPTAYQVIQDDDKVDNLFHEINSSLQQSFKGRALSEQEIKNIISVNALAHNLERIGDSATNIAEATIYLTEGKDIRHGNSK